ncbi:MAG: hypothetical protein H7346_18210 [Burkholderiaceae bacterium]|nr:hypothetical protein [Burkholderiaceae bacterium]
MWWGKPARVYLGRGTLLLQCGSREVQAIRHNIPQVLSQIVPQAVPHAIPLSVAPEQGRQNEPDLAALLALLDGRIPRGSPVELHLSAALCPALDVSYPEGMTRWADLQAFARAVSAAQLGLAPDDIDVQIDPSSPCIVAPFTRQDLEAVRAWAGASSLHLRSIRPLWSIASGLKLARGARAIALHETDGLTLLGSPSGAVAQRGMSLPLTPAGPQARGQLSQPIQQAIQQPIQPLVNRLQHGLGITAADCLQLRFALPGSGGPLGSPAHLRSLGSPADLCSQGGPAHVPPQSHPANHPPQRPQAGLRGWPSGWRSCWSLA